ncbi:hypothetical protein BH23PSE1_BH23PSE1_02060 [soil metagenome]
MSQAIAALSGGGVLLAWAAVLLSALAGLGAALPVGLAGLALCLVLQAPNYSRYALGHLGLGAAFALVTLLRVPAPGRIIAEAFASGGFIIVLFASFGILREAAQSSPLVLATGRMLVAQPPGRRYFAIAGGGTLLGAILNFGVVALFAGMIRDANTAGSAGGDGALRGDRERRMMLALLRGFSVVMFWCPLTMAFAITTAAIPEARWPLMAAFGLVAACVGVISGWLVDGPPVRERGLPRDAVPIDWPRLAPLAGLLAVMSALAVLVDELTPGRLIDGVILFVPLLGLVWLVHDAGIDGLRRAGRYVTHQIPQQRSELAILGNAAFVGTLMAALLPPAAVEAVLGPQGVPAVLIPPLFLALVVIFGQLGANPLISVFVLASIMRDPAAYGVDPSLLATSLALGWGLAIGSSPATAATMFIGSLTGHGSFTIGGRWNGPHTWIAVLLCSLILIALAYAF